MLNILGYLPPITAMTPEDLVKLPWKGALSHVGPLEDMTPLQVALTDKTNCALYMICAGCIGLCLKRTATVLDQSRNAFLPELIFAYQFDWRYARVELIDLEIVEDRKNKPEAIQAAIGYFFIDAITRLPDFFLAENPFENTAFMINLTRHLCGTDNKLIVDNWVRVMIKRLDEVAAQTEELSSSIYDYQSLEDWEAAVRIIHGKPLPPEILDLGWMPESVDLSALAELHFSEVDWDRNPFLAKVD